MLKSETSFVVRYAETDQMGIVHHSNYPIWFEAGRTDFIKTMGMTYSQMEAQGILLPLIELKCSFKSAARYEDEVVIVTSIKQFTYTRIVFYYEVYRKGSGTLLAMGETSHAWTTRELKPVNLKKHSPEIYQLLYMAYEQSQ
ncbi:MAG: acyl-CoA thioesterase [Clostridia bacterium]|nr:acyl-CoA thioesterase [Clostridia bacterium]